MELKIGTLYKMKKDGYLWWSDITQENNEYVLSGTTQPLCNSYFIPLERMGVSQQDGIVYKIVIEDKVGYIIITEKAKL